MGRNLSYNTQSQFQIQFFSALNNLIMSTRCQDKKKLKNYISTTNQGLWKYDKLKTVAAAATAAAKAVTCNIFTYFFISVRYTNKKLLVINQGLILTLKHFSSFDVLNSFG